jgi:hypothetical protein
VAIIAGNLELVSELGELEQGLEVKQRWVRWCGKVSTVLLEACGELACSVWGKGEVRRSRVGFPTRSASGAGHWRSEACEGCWELAGACCWSSGEA